MNDLLRRAAESYKKGVVFFLGSVYSQVNFSSCCASVFKFGQLHPVIYLKFMYSCDFSETVHCTQTVHLLKDIDNIIFLYLIIFYYIYLTNKFWDKLLNYFPFTTI